MALLQRAIGASSVTGAEAGFAQLLAEELRALGAADVVLENFLPDRPNVTARRTGQGDLPPVLLIGHTDTVHVRGWRERWAGDPREDPFGGAIVEGCVWGRGSADLKAGICMTLEAVRLLDRASIPLACDVQFAFVGDEESGEPGTGVSAGMRSFCQRLDEGALPVRALPSMSSLPASTFTRRRLASSSRTSPFGDGRPISGCPSRAWMR